MASIKINNLQPAGSDLFSDSENYLNELNDQELDLVNGGFFTPSITITVPIIITMM